MEDATVLAPQRRLTPCQQGWLAHLEAWRVRGGALKAYAIEHGLSVSGLYTARRELTRRGAWPGEAPAQRAATLVPVRLRPSPAVFRVLLPNGIAVEVPECAGPEATRALLACVKTLA